MPKLCYVVDMSQLLDYSEFPEVCNTLETALAGTPVGTILPMIDEMQQEGFMDLGCIVAARRDNFDRIIPVLFPLSRPADIYMILSPPFFFSGQGYTRFQDMEYKQNVRAKEFISILRLYS